jgi:hypothetical protein
MSGKSRKRDYHHGRWRGPGTLISLYVRARPQLQDCYVLEIFPKFCIQRKEFMKEKHKKKIEEIIGTTKCPKDFKCTESEFEVMGKVKDVGLENYIECLESDSRVCMFALSFGDGYLCQCPLRVYLAKKLKI